MSDNPKTAADAQHAAVGIRAESAAGFQRTTHPDAQWFGTAGLGLFMHWGISTVSGKGDISWSMMAELPWMNGTVTQITPADYFAQARQFQPNQWDPDRVLAAAKAAGFRYAVLTTRHHDGYALWPSEHGEFGVRQFLPGVDLVGDYVAACRRQGLKVGLYYSPPDWYFNRHYMSFHFGSEDQKNFPGRAHFGLHHEVLPVRPPKPPGHEAAFHQYLRGQITELLTRYGPVDLLWFDGGPPVMSIDELRALQPHIVINPRMHGVGDFATPELHLPATRPPGWWELCDIWPCGGWSYDPNHERYKPLSWFWERYNAVRHRGGNLLLNVGPKADGSMPAVYYERMAELAKQQRNDPAVGLGLM
jgi:alpha-L-fucosidase